MLEVNQKSQFQNSIELLLSALNHLKIKGQCKDSHQTSSPPENAKLVITNQDPKKRTSQQRYFAEMLQARDNVLQHNFRIEIDLEGFKSKKGETEFTSTQQYDSLLKEIKIFLRESISNVVSISFNRLNEGKLEDKEAMEYAAKNILLNIQQIFRKTVKSIEQNSVLWSSINSEQLRSELISEIQQILNNILINLADNYPQAPASGGTPRMKEVINEINHVDNQQNDLIFANNLCISKHLKLITGVSRDNQLTQKVDFENQDYTEFIMEVINSAILASQKNQEDSRERTVKQIFEQFNQKLFCFSQNKRCQSIINQIDNKNQDLIQKGSQKEQLGKDSLKKKIFKYFDTTLQRNHETLEKQMESSSESFIDENEGALEELRKEKKYLIGQKIPHFVKVFSRQDINNKNFTARHSSVLRILTKWAEYLQDIFKNAESHIKQRLYPYKNIKNELVFLRDEQEKKRLISQLNQEYKEVKTKFYEIFNNNEKFISLFLMAEQEESQSHVCRYTDTRIASSKINAVLTSHMLKYTSILIHHLLKAGREIMTNRKEQNINLIVFRVSDLLRSKIQMNQSSFISLLKTVYLLDSNESMRSKFKLVRIKNKLDDPANNIIINFLFMGKVQCELQLSIQQARGKQKNYYIFSHLIYELTRGIFGSIAECAIMTSQLDPMIASCKGNYYEEKYRKREIQAVSLEQKCRTVKSQEDLSEPEIEEKMSELNEEILNEDKRNQIFECVHCKKLIINQSQLFLTKDNEFLCNQCVIETKEPEQQLWNYDLKKAILQGIQNKQLQRLKDLNSLKLIDNQCILSLSGNGKLSLNVIIEIEKQLKVFLVKVDSKLLKEIDSRKFDFTSIDYFNVTNNLKNRWKKQNMNYQLLYLARSGPSSLSNDIFALMDVKRQLVESKLNALVKAFRDFRQEKNIIKTIKFKAQIININHDESKFKTLEKIISKLVLRQSNSDKNMDAFKYKRYRHLDLSNLKEIQIQGTSLKSIPLWLPKCLNFKKIALENNQIQQIEEDDLPLTTSQLFLRDNKITTVSLSKLMNLTRLDLDSNCLTDVDLRNLSNLSKVSISNNKLTEIDLSELKNLTFISLNNNQLASINITKLTNLNELQLNNNKLQEIDLSGLSSLTKLSLNNNQLTSIDLSQVTNLTTLNLLNNKLESVDLSHLANLIHTILNKNRITEVNLSNLTNLVSLCLEDNKISHLDLQDLSSLTRLDLGSNELEEIDLSSLTTLTMLGLDRNNLHGIDLGNLSNLTNLDLDFNQLQSIDTTNLTSLAELYLSNNNLSSVQLQNLTNLYILSINDNPLSQIELRDLINLKELHVDRNLIVEYNFEEMQGLEKLFVYNGFITEEQLNNLSPNVLIQIIEPEEEEP